MPLRYKHYLNERQHYWEALKLRCALCRCFSLHLHLARSVVHSFSHLCEALSSFEGALILSEGSQRVNCETVSFLLDHFSGLQQRGHFAGRKINTCRAKLLTNEHFS